MTENNWFWLSFCDADLPEDSQFLGGCYVPGNDVSEALTSAWTLGCNPGGEVAAMGPVPEDLLRDNVPEANWRRLLQRGDIGEAKTLAELDAEGE